MFYEQEKQLQAGVYKAKGKFVILLQFWRKCQYLFLKQAFHSQVLFIQRIANWSLPTVAWCNK